MGFWDFLDIKCDDDKKKGGGSSAFTFKGKAAVAIDKFALPASFAIGFFSSAYAVLTYGPTPTAIFGGAFVVPVAFIGLEMVACALSGENIISCGMWRATKELLSAILYILEQLPIVGLAAKAGKGVGDYVKDSTHCISEGLKEFF